MLNVSIASYKSDDSVLSNPLPKVIVDNLLPVLKLPKIGAPPAAPLLSENIAKILSLSATVVVAVAAEAPSIYKVVVGESYVHKKCPIPGEPPFIAQPPKPALDSLVLNSTRIALLLPIPG